MLKLTESNVESLAIEILEAQGWKYLSPEDQELERESLGEVILKERLKAAIERINPGMNETAREQALKAVLNLSSQNLMNNNETFHKMLTDGVEVEYLQEGNMKGDKVWLVDYAEIENNDFVVCNQFTVIEGEKNKRPDLVLLVNGLPLVVIELKNAADENATVKKAYMQLQNYKTAIPSLFYYNSILIASDGL